MQTPLDGLSELNRAFLKRWLESVLYLNPHFSAIIGPAKKKEVREVIKRERNPSLLLFKQFNREVNSERYLVYITITFDDAYWYDLLFTWMELEFGIPKGEILVRFYHTFTAINSRFRVENLSNETIKKLANTIRMSGYMEYSVLDKDKGRFMNGMKFYSGMMGSAVNDEEGRDKIKEHCRCILDELWDLRPVFLE